MIKRFLALSAAAAIVGVAGVFAIGWALAAPVQTHVGKPPEDLRARPVEFKSDSGATVHGWWCPTEPAAAQLCFCRAFAPID